MTDFKSIPRWHIRPRWMRFISATDKPRDRWRERLYLCDFVHVSCRDVVSRATRVTPGFASPLPPPGHDEDKIRHLFRERGPYRVSNKLMQSARATRATQFIIGLAFTRREPTTKKFSDFDYKIISWGWLGKLRRAYKMKIWKLTIGSLYVKSYSIYIKIRLFVIVAINDRKERRSVNQAELR